MVHHPVLWHSQYSSIQVVWAQIPFLSPHPSEHEWHGTFLSCSVLIHPAMLCSCPFFSCAPRLPWDPWGQCWSCWLGCQCVSQQISYCAPITAPTVWQHHILVLQHGCTCWTFSCIGGQGLAVTLDCCTHLKSTSPLWGISSSMSVLLLPWPH